MSDYQAYLLLVGVMVFGFFCITGFLMYLTLREPFHTDDEK